MEPTRSVMAAEEITCSAVMSETSPSSPFFALTTQWRPFASQRRRSRLVSMKIWPPMASIFLAAVSHIMPGPWRG